MKMMKIMSVAMSLCMCLFLNGLSVCSADEVNVYLNGEAIAFDQPPVIQDGRVLLPIRAVCEALGADVYYQETSGDIGNFQIILIAKNETKVFMAVDETFFYKFNGFDVKLIEDAVKLDDAEKLETFEFDVAPQIINNRTLLPVRAVCEAMGVTVAWDEATSSVHLTCSDEYILNTNADKTFAEPFFACFNRIDDEEDTHQPSVEPSGSPNKLRVWAANPYSKLYDNFNDNEVFRELERRTGVSVNYIHPPAGQETEWLNLMVASGDLPDIVIMQSAYYRPYYDEVFIPIDQYLNSAPNFKVILSNPDIQKEIFSDDSKIYGMPMICTNPLPITTGLVIRQDWLNELKLPVPKSVNDWYVTLKAFKEKKNATAPLTLIPNYALNDIPFTGAYGVSKGFYEDNGTVKFGAVSPQYKKFLSEMQKWYAEGLIDAEFATNSIKTVDAKIIDGKAGAAITAYGKISEYNSKSIPFVAAPYPEAASTDVTPLAPRKTYLTGVKAYISKNCKFPENAVKWLDYMYGDEGSRLLNYGIEGLTYVMNDGKIQYTPRITNNPEPYSTSNPLDTRTEGYSMLESLRKYTAPNFAFLYDFDRYAPAYTDNANHAAKIWSGTGNSSVQTLPLMQLSSSENMEYTEIMTGINKYINEMTIKLILGTVDISEFDGYVQTINDMGIDKALKIQQSALNRYNARK